MGVSPSSSQRWIPTAGVWPLASQSSVPWGEDCWGSEGAAGSQPPLPGGRGGVCAVSTQHTLPRGPRQQGCPASHPQLTC